RAARANGVAAAGREAPQRNLAVRVAPINGALDEIRLAAAVQAKGAVFLVDLDFHRARGRRRRAFLSARRLRGCVRQACRQQQNRSRSAVTTPAYAFSHGATLPPGAAAGRGSASRKVSPAFGCVF